MQNFSFLVHLDDTFAGGWLAVRPAGRPNLKIMLTSAQLGLAGAWAELGNKWSKNLAANDFFFYYFG